MADAINQQQVFFATAPKGLEYLLAQELLALGAQQVKEKRAGVSFLGDIRLAYTVCLWSRLANRILMPILTFNAPDPEALYQGIQQIAWNEHVNITGSLAVDFTCNHSQITHSQFGAQKVKDAIVDQLRHRYGSRPNVELVRPDLMVNVYLHKDTAIVSIDLSGESLHKRNYRIEGGSAPLKENLAAAILLRAKWHSIAEAGGIFFDPLCGSGTLLIEAAWIAADIAPGLNRQYFGFSKWIQHKPDLWNEIKAEAEHRRIQGLKRMPVIIGYDADPIAICHAKANIARAKLSDYIQVECRELAQHKPLTGIERGGLVATNPPYGERLGNKAQLKYFYQHLGDILRQYYKGWQTTILVSDVEMGKQLGIRAIAKYNFYNGILPCVLLIFNITEELFYKEYLKQPFVSSKAIAKDLDPKIEMFVNRLHKNIRNLRRWIKKEDITCYRIYNADLPEYAVAIDRYQQWVHVQEYAPPKTIDPEKARQRLIAIMGVLPDALQIPKENIFLKVRQKQRGNNQYQRLSHSEEFHQVQEGAAKFLVNFNDYLDTGLFLDHRITRQMITSLAKGGHFLNLFAYTGTASVCAALGDALSTTSVDLSKNYIDWAKRNMALNGLSEVKNSFIQADCMQWLQTNTKRYDLIFLDPPTFSNSKRMQDILDIKRDHVSLIRQAIRHLNKQGLLIFSTNKQNFRLAENKLSDLSIIDITAQSIPKDFERTPNVHYCWRISHKNK